MSFKALSVSLLLILIGGVSRIHANVTLNIVTNPVAGGTVSGAGSYASGTTVSSAVAASYGKYISDISYNPGGRPDAFNFARILYSSDPTMITSMTVNQTLNSNTTLTVTFGPCSPVFNSPPTTQIAVISGNVTFSNSMTGRQPISYQWQREGTNIAGATSASLTLTNVQAVDAGNYSLVATNAFGGTNRLQAVLTVRDFLVLTNNQPVAGDAITVVGSAMVGLQSRFPGGLICYTLDGSVPDFTSTPYYGSLYVYSSGILRVIAYSSDFSQSVQIGPVAITVIPAYYLSTYTSQAGYIAINPNPLDSMFASNSTVTVTAVPYAGWTFMEWRGDLSGNDLTNTLVMNQDKYVEAMFGTTVATTTFGNGTVTVIPDVPLHPYGSSIEVVATPAAGNYFVLWGNAASGTMNPLYYGVMQPTQTYQAIFTTLPTNQVSLTVSATRGGYVETAWTTNKFTIGSTNLLTAVPAEGQQFLYWSGDASGNQNPLPLTLTSNMVVMAHFSQWPSLEMLADADHLTLYVGGVMGSVCRLQTSTNLTSWTDLHVYTNYFNESFRFIEPVEVGVPFQMYRAAAQ